MKKLTNAIAALLTALLLLHGPLSYAKAPLEDTTKQSRTQPNENDLESHGHYVNKTGQTVHSPTKTKSGQVPAGASAQCRDGTYSFSKHRSGTCSHHGGVGQWQ